MVQIVDIQENGSETKVLFSDSTELIALSSTEGIRVVIDRDGNKRSAFASIEGGSDSALSLKDREYLEVLGLEWIL